MTPPYEVWINHAGDHTHIACGTFAEACERALNVPPKRYQFVRVIGDGYDVDCDEDGYFECDDGLTPDERDKLEEIGL